MGLDTTDDKGGALMSRPAVYLVFTRSYGILQKTDDSIASARSWAAKALPGEVTHVLRTTASVDVAELEAEHRAQLQAVRS